MTWESIAGNETGCGVGSVKCEHGQCIPRSSVCDSVKNCEDDERFEYCRGTIRCSDSTRYEEVCRCKIFPANCIANYGTACNGVADCPLPIPENGRITAGTNTFPEDECDAFCYKESANFTCHRSFISMVGIAERIIPCHPAPVFLDMDIFTLSGNKITLGKLFPTSINGEQECNGVEDCELGDDEENCPDRFRCETVQPGLVSIPMDETCDGTEHCKDGSDETEQLCGNKRFRCSSLGGKKVNIDKELVCDFMITCDDGSDEKGCNDGRFYCEDGIPLFVRERQKFDGRGDCLDWSDECPMLNQTESTNVFSSRYELIANPVLRALVWIMGLLSIGGNATVLYIETNKLKNYRKLTAIAVANRLLVLNLATSDIIMGIYLVSLGIAGATMQGQYCSQDRLWRSSSSCITLGVLTVLSSETSVITMILLTSCRLYAVLRPFKSSTHPRKRIVFSMMLSAWAASLAIALVPLAPQLSGTFVTHTEFDNAPYFRHLRTPLDEARRAFKTLMTYDLKPNVSIPDEFSVSQLSWQEMEVTAEKFFAHDHFKIQHLFGYYSIDSVCIPKFFISRSDRAWGFSFFVNLFNFCAFTFVASAYLAIYLQSRKRAGMRSSASGHWTW